LLLNRKAGPAGRGFWFSGAAGHRDLGGVALNNCWFTTAEDWMNFILAQDLLMLGGGVGLSVEYKYTSKLPMVKRGVNVVHKFTKDADFIVPDSREGWNELVRRTLESFLVTGKSFSYSTYVIRPAGEPIKGFGGKASGPQPLITLVEKISSILRTREGKKIRPIDAMDILCAIGEMVVSGNVRRSAIIILGDPWDKDYLKAKRWDLGNVPNQRAMANLSVVVDDVEDLHPLFWKTYEAGEPFGIVNRTNIQKYGRMGELKKDTAIGVNPSLRAGTRILTTRGIVPIESLEDKEFQVRNLNGEISNSSCWLSGRDKPLWELELDSGQKYFATAEHKWPVALNGRYVKVETKDLVPGDVFPVLRSKTLPFDSSDSSYAEGFFVGWLYGDGWVTERSDNQKTQYGLIVSAKDVASGVHTRLVDYLKSITGNEYGGHDNNGNLEYNIVNVLLDERMKQLGVKHKSEGLPSSVWSGSEEFRKGLVDGLLSSDGSVEQASRESLRVNWSSAHANLASDFAELLGFYGVQTRHSVRELKGAAFPNGKNYDRTYRSHVLRISGAENIVHFRSVFRLSVAYKQELLSRFYENVRAASHGSAVLVSVKETLLKEDVWDITVRDATHCFQLSHCVTGNCAEATLEGGPLIAEPCNLQELPLPNIEDEDEFVLAARMMHRWGKRVTMEKYHWGGIDEVVKRNRRIGTGITGCLQSPLFNPKSLDRAYAAIQEENRKYSKELGIPESIRTTVVKPSGTMSKVFDMRGYEGIHPAYSRHYIQRVRFASNDPLVPMLRLAGHYVEPVQRFDGTLDSSTVVVDFYEQAPQGAPVADEDWDTWKQLDTLLMAQRHWADQAVSVTVYYKREDLAKLKVWLAENLKSLKSISFLCHSEHGFTQAPKEAIDADTYAELSAKIKPIKIDSDVSSSEDLLDGLECMGGTCPVK
jgi:ribonucleotide reductase alpha subunit